MSATPVKVDLDQYLAAPLALQAGSDGIGLVGADIPVEVLLAVGRPFAHLPWRADGRTPAADRWLESSFPFWTRSILEQWHAGAFDGLRDVVFSRTDDASQRLYYYVRELQLRGQLGGPRPHVFDLALVPREASLAHSARSVATLLQDLGGDPLQLPLGIERANALRCRLGALQGGRTGSGAWFEALSRAVLWNMPGSWLEHVEPPSSAQCRRVMLAGSLPPDARLHEAVEAGGASVIGETHGLRLDRLGAVTGDDADHEPARRIARGLIHRCAGPRAFSDSAQRLLQQFRDQRADAVVLWLTREDEALAWQLPAQREALIKEGIPVLVLPAAQWNCGDGVLERVKAFCKELV